MSSSRTKVSINDSIHPADKSSNEDVDSDDSKITGFARGLEVDHIVGACPREDGKLMFLVKWKNLEEADLVEANDVYKKDPQVAIQFFEAHLSYNHSE